jgi:regulator of sigma E protease
MVIVIYITAALVLLGLCIFVHELGHLLGGRMVGIKAKTFSIGFGKGILKKKIGDTTYQIGPIPLGGFCQFYGEDPSEERTGESYEFLSAHPMRRVVTVIMGPLFNLIFGILIFFVMNLVGYSKDTNSVYIPESAQHRSAAYNAGIRSGDRIVKIGDREVASFSDIQIAVFFSDGKNLDVTFERDGEKITKPVTPSRIAKGTYEIGVMPEGERILVTDLEDGAAADAGMKNRDQIVSIDGIPMKNTDEFVQYISKRPEQELKFSILRSGEKKELTVTPRLRRVVQFQVVEDNGKKGEMLRFPMSEDIDDFLGKGSLQVNDEKMTTYETLEQVARDNSGKDISFQIKDKKFSGTVELAEVGFIGVHHTVKPAEVEIPDYSVGEALALSFTEPYEFIVMNVRGIGMIIAGKLSARENLSGPIRIGKMAGDVYYYKGKAQFILLMAKISIILMVMNLLPIPVVDGSHIIFFLVETVRRKPLSQKVMERIQTVGVALLITLFAFIIVNDIWMAFFR